ncbi:MAG TPA: flagellar assembly protein T N-terminal domain-containing protein [Polyangia bacterium]
MRFALASVLLLGLAGGALAQEPAFEALGQAPVVGGDRVRARDRALDEALRQAVEQAVATVLDPDQVVARASDLKLRIYPRARGYVANYRILDEGEVPASGLYQVHLSAEVATGRLARDLAAGSATHALPHLNAKSRAIVCVRAKADGEPAEVLQALPPRASQALSELLAAHDVVVLPAPADCSEAGLSAAARAESAEGALFATIEVSPAGAIRGTDKLAAHVRARLELIEPDGRVSAASDAERDAYDAVLARAAADATADALADAGQKIEGALAARFSAAAPAGAALVRLEGVTRFSDYQAVARALAALPGVAGVEPRRFVPGEIELLVRTAQPAAQLGAALTRLPPSGVRVMVKNNPGGALTIEVAPAEVTAPEPG